jgi:hypothetical protein
MEPSPALETHGHAEAFDLLGLPVLELILSWIPARQRILILPQVCSTLLALVEDECKSVCEQRGWQLARRPRGRNADASPTPWRRLYLRHGCIACCAVGDFCARETSNSHARFLLCGPCARSDVGRQRLVPGNLKLDLTGLSGKPLYTRRADPFCAAMHAEGVKRRGRGLLTLDAAGAARAGVAGPSQRPAKQRRAR